ncbi:MAG: BrnA antitoxin family protein [Candidatus Nitrosopelagicus sp.]|nr:BrnA antitoxin family protein [Candidatus Nitrosopelagicus sp.]
MQPLVKRKPHVKNKEQTNSISYRLPSKLLENLETEARQKNISHNVLVKQILQKYVLWERFAEKIGMVPVPQKILQSLGGRLSHQEILEIIDALFITIKDSVMFMKGGYDLKRTIETLEDYMRNSGMESDHRVEGNLHHFVIQHKMGMQWSIFTELLLRRVFAEFEKETGLKFQTTESTVIATISLGSDFDEHDY